MTAIADNGCVLPDFFSQPLELGLGLIGIGRSWGHVPAPVPSAAEAHRFLEAAFASGIRYLDTAPSYAHSEPRLGEFLRSLTREERASLTVATKFGEEWDFERNEPFVDHSFDGLRRSLERSLQRLGSIDVLQLHKTTPEALASEEVLRAFELARSLGVAAVGPSVSEEASAAVAVADGRWQMLQLPLNPENRRFEAFALEAARAGKWLALNRPLAMGKLASAREECFGFLRALPLHGVVLIGTRSPEHLSDNLAAWAAAE